MCLVCTTWTQVFGARIWYHQYFRTVNLGRTSVISLRRSQGEEISYTHSYRHNECRGHEQTDGPPAVNGGGQRRMQGGPPIDHVLCTAVRSVDPSLESWIHRFRITQERTERVT